MQKEIRILAPAKVNLGLKVLPKREDGFHNIESIFQTIDIKDLLEITVLEGFGECTIQCAQLKLPENNTLSSAYKAFSQVTKRPSKSVSVILTKRIPSGGGLGGGSSDAAALVRALEEINDITLTRNQLDEIANMVGSDVFFFLHCGQEIDGAAIVTGRGEYVKKITKRNDLFFVLVFPNVFSSTKEAYSLVDELYARNDQVIYPELDNLNDIYNSAVSRWTFVNTFTPALISRYSDIENCLNSVKKTGALFADMSGSGSTVFGVFELREKALSAIESLKNQGFTAVLA